MDLAHILYNLYQNGHIAFLPDGTAVYDITALQAIAKATEATNAFALVRTTHERAIRERPNAASALRLH